jgi:hypothetical protein
MVVAAALTAALAWGLRTPRRAAAPGGLEVKVAPTTSSPAANPEFITGSAGPYRIEPPAGPTASLPLVVPAREIPKDTFPTDATGLLPRSFARYETLGSKALRSGDEEREWRALLQDGAMAKRALGLLAHAPRAMAWGPSVARMEAVDFLEEAWSKTGPRPDLENAVAQYLEDHAQMGPEIPINVRRMTAGDQIELAQLLARWAPERLAQLKLRVGPESRMGRVLALAERRERASRPQGGSS